MGVVESHQPPALAIMQGERVTQTVRPLRCWRCAFDLEFQPMSLPEMMDAAVKAQQEFQCMVLRQGLPCSSCVPWMIAHGFIHARIPKDGCLRLLRGPDNLDDYVVEVPPVNGTLLVFPNGPSAWHGHRRFVGQRHSMQLNYMTTDTKARSELRRHRISAFVKRLTMAA